ncbi:hypothetical protein ASE40_10200 [Flavobacterium sp. Root935]|uniref:glycosyltransferase family 2 protein n=1 Tax=Flavobacterium sp. Root935 TaxID=1736610 RepID=UPI00070C8722|nr:glycosyltransferase [Flavobacterium sp. Root935]KRD61881.1 hypothetical protein ASE40_10200 [Flavobacterium sp. Root935]
MNTQSPVITVLMPVYNGEKYIKEAIISILNQSFRNFEFIIINDGSTDETENIISSFKDNRIRYVKNQKNLQLIKTLNYGIELAKGKYIARMDADDIAMQDRLEKQLDQFLLEDKIDMVNSQCLLLNEDGNKSRKNRTNISLNYEALKYVSIFQTMIVHPAVMIKTSVIKRFKYSDQPNAVHIEDFELWNRLFENNIVCYTIPEPLLYYRLNSESITNTNSKQQQERIRKMTISILNNYGAEIDNEALDLIQGQCEKCNFKMLKKTDLYLCNFFLKIKKHDLISLEGYSDLLLWKDFKISYVSIKSFKRSSIYNKIGILFFLATKTPSIINIKLIKKIF